MKKSIIVLIICLVLFPFISCTNNNSNKEPLTDVSIEINGCNDFKLESNFVYMISVLTIGYCDKLFFEFDNSYLTFINEYDFNFKKSFFIENLSVKEKTGDISFKIFSNSGFVKKYIFKIEDNSSDGLIINSFKNLYSINDVSENSIIKTTSLTEYDNVIRDYNLSFDFTFTEHYFSLNDIYFVFIPQYQFDSDNFIKILIKDNKLLFCFKKVIDYNTIVKDTDTYLCLFSLNKTIIKDEYQIYFVNDFLNISY